MKRELFVVAILSNVSHSFVLLICTCSCILFLLRFTFFFYVFFFLFRFVAVYLSLLLLYFLLLFYIKCLVDWLHGQLVVWSFDCLSFRLVVCCIAIAIALLPKCWQLSSITLLCLAMFHCWHILCIVADNVANSFQRNTLVIYINIFYVYVCLYACLCVFDDFVHSQSFCCWFFFNGHFVTDKWVGCLSPYEMTITWNV